MADGESILLDCVADRFGERALVSLIVDQAGFILVGHEATFDEDGRVFDTGQHAEAGTLEAPVEGLGFAGFLVLEHAQHAAVHGGGEGDIGRIVVVAGLGAKVAGLQTPAVVRDADG